MSQQQRGGKPRQGQPVLDRAFRILDAFTAEDSVLTLTQIAERTGIPLSSALRLSLHLVRLGAMERLPDGEYTIGLKLLEYAALAPRGHGLRALALPYMDDLLRATRQHVQLAVREGEDGVIVERLSAPGAGTVLYYAGGRFPLHGTGLGLVLLAHARPEFQAAYLSGDLALESEAESPSKAQLRERLDQVRATGIARYSRQSPEPAETVAGPIFDRTRTCIAALSVLGAGGSLDPRVAQPAVIAMCHAISREVSRSTRR